MASNDDLITALMIRYARHEKLTDEEMRTLEEWWQQSPEHQRLAEQFGDEDWVKAQLAKMKPAPMKEMWEGINKYLDEQGAPDDRETPMEWERPEYPVQRRIRWMRPLTVAAAVALCVCAVWLVVRKNGATSGGSAPVAAVNRPSEPIAREDGVLLVGSDGSTVDMNAVPNGTIVWRSEDAYLKKVDTDQLVQYGRGGAGLFRQAVLVGKKMSNYFVRLADGSSVWLNRGARFEFPVSNGNGRDVYDLQGKGFFEVTKDPSRAFVVRTPHDRAVEVLGTVFHVDADKEDSTSRVDLLSGSVRVRSGVDSLLLTPAHQAELGTDRIAVRSMRDSGAGMAWVKKSLYFHFDNTKFKDAVEAVAAWYGYTVSNPKNLRGVTITDNLRKDPTPERVVQAIGQVEIGYLYIWISNKVITISDLPNH
jgi:ferric-dicitrate binding protein FerR (iron transport regulator)